MGEVETSGPQAEAMLQRLLSNDVSKLEAGGAQYSVLCRADGGIVDDLFTYRLDDDRYLTVTNAANHEQRPRLVRGARRRLRRDEVADAIADYAMLAVQGPKARVDRHRAGRGRAAAAHAHGDAAASPAPRCSSAGRATPARTASRSCSRRSAPWRCGTRCWPPGSSRSAWAPATRCASRRCFHLYGNDIDEHRNPIEAGLGWCCKEGTGFIGSEAVAAARERGTEQTLVPFVLVGPGIPRQGNAVVSGGAEVGVVTSGTLSPSLDVGIGMAYVVAELAEPGTEVEIDVRGKLRAARIESKPLYRKEA